MSLSPGWGKKHQLEIAENEKTGKRGMADLEKGPRELLEKKDTVILEKKDTVTGESTKPVGTSGSRLDNREAEGGTGKKLNPQMGEDSRRSWQAGQGAGNHRVGFCGVLL